MAKQPGKQPEDQQLEHHPFDWWENSNVPQTGTCAAQSPVMDHEGPNPAADHLAELASNKDLGRIS